MIDTLPCCRNCKQILNRNAFSEGNDTNQGCHVFLFYLFFGGFSLEKIILRITKYSNIFIFMAVTNNIYQKHKISRIQCGYEFRVDRTCFGIYNTNTSFKNVWRTWGTALPTLLADLMIFCPLGPTNFKNSAPVSYWFIIQYHVQKHDFES